MNKKWFGLGLLLLLLNSSVALAAPLWQSLQRSVAILGQKAEVAIVVEDLATKKVLFAKNDRHLLIPASLLKLFTASFANHYLGSRFVFETKMTRYGPVSNHHLRGGLHWQMQGDPLLSTADIHDLLLRLKKDGIDTITGSLSVDDSVFDQNHFGPGWMWDELDDGYAAPISAIILDHNMFTIKVQPGDGVGDLARIDQNPLMPQIESQVITVKQALAAQCKQLLVSELGQHLKLVGCMGLQEKADSVDVAYRDVRKHFKRVVLQQAKEMHLSLPTHWSWVGNKLLKGQKGRVDYEHQSFLLPHLLSVMLHESDNLIAEVLFKSLGKTWFKAPGTWNKGALFAKSVLQRLPGKHHFRIVDGSGLSRYNALSAQMMSEMLNSIYKRDKASFLTYLPQPGKKGSLLERLQHAKGRVYAKTGSMTGVQNLAGYLDVGSDHPWSFVIMINQFPDTSTKAQQEVDHLVYQLLQIKNKSRTH
jgi:serine-type D-Ala-D-Ala carboxypeptidase/endopeptidase (penicillin-binding protein 4)